MTGKMVSREKRLGKKEHLEIIEKTAKYVEKNLEGDSAHDWWHIYRVWKMAKRIAKEEKANMFVVELAALLHDLGDYKVNPNAKYESEPAEKWLNKLKVDKETISEVCHIIDNMCYSKRNEAEELSLEGKIVQDSDWLDAIGAVGIARCFAFNGNKGNPIYDPNIKLRMNMSKEEYRKTNSPAINHFYEKLLLLKDKMNTNTAKKIAKKRTKLMEKYLNSFFKEWEGEE